MKLFVLARYTPATEDGTWNNPVGGGCRANDDNWKKWMPAGYTSKTQAKAATQK